MKTLTNNTSILNTLILILIVSIFMSCKDNDSDNPDPAEPIRYLEKGVFSEFKTQFDMNYGEGTFQTFDLVEPVGDEQTDRTLILLSPGGAFASYTREASLRGMGQDLATRGYVVAVVRYTLADPNSGIDYGLLDNAVQLSFEASRDQRTAVKFFKENAAEFGIDPDNIFIGGWSTGGQVSFYTGLLNEASDIELFSDDKLRASVQKAYEANGNRFDQNDGINQSTDVRGILTMLNYTTNLNHIKEYDPAIMLIAHEKEHLKDGTLVIDGFNDSTSDHTYPMFGANQIHDYLMNQNYTLGGNHDYILMDEWKGDGYDPNVATLTSDNYDAIAAFFYRNRME